MPSVAADGESGTLRSITRLSTTSFGSALASLALALSFVLSQGCGSGGTGERPVTGYTYENPTPWPISYGPDQRFLAPNRDRLAICVEAVGVDDTLESEARLSVEDALRVLAGHPTWLQLNLSSPEPQVVAGCPAGPDYFEESGKAHDRPVYGRSIVEPAYPSYYGIHVYVVSPKEIDELDWYPAQVTLEEESCYFDVCRQVTTGLYATPEALRDPDLIEDLLMRAIGLE
jgi:hypothetical protein